MYGRKGFKRKAYSTKGRQSVSFAKKRRYSSKGGSFGGFLSQRHTRSLLPRADSWFTPGGQGNKPTFALQRGPSWFPERMRVPLKYTIQVTITVTSGVGQQLVIAGNDITDPSTSFGATQPYGYDVLKTVYSRFAVLGSAIQVKFLESETGTGTLAAALQKVALFPSNVTTSMVSDFESAAQRPLSKSTIFRVDGSLPPEGCFQMRNYCSTAKIQGVPPGRILMDGFFHGVTNATPPTNIWYWNCVMNALDGTASQNICFQVVMIYYTELYDLVDLAST